MATLIDEVRNEMKEMNKNFSEADYRRIAKITASWISSQDFVVKEVDLGFQFVDGNSPILTYYFGVSKEIIDASKIHLLNSFQERQVDIERSFQPDNDYAYFLKPKEHGEITEIRETLSGINVRAFWEFSEIIIDERPYTMARTISQNSAQSTYLFKGGN